MLEAVNLSNSSTKGILINCDNGVHEVSRNRRRESDGKRLSLEVPVRYKRRKASVNRNFPKGCGVFAKRIKVETCKDGVAIDSGERLQVRTDGALKEVGSVKQTGNLVEPTTLAMVKCSDEIKSPPRLKSLNYEITNAFKVLTQAEALEPKKNAVPLVKDTPNITEFCQVNYQWSFDLSELIDPSKTTTNSLEVFNEMEVLEPPKNVVPVLMEIPHDSEWFQVNYQRTLDQSESVNSSKTLEPETIDLLKNLNQKELVSNVKFSNAPESINLLRDVSLPEEEDLPSSSLVQSPMDSACPDASPLSKVSELPVMRIPVVGGVVGSMRSKYHTRRRISASRNFPPACGKNAPCVSKKKYLKSTACSNDGSLCYEKFSGENRSPKQMLKADSEEIREKFQDGATLKSKLKGNSTKEIGDRAHIRSEGDVKKEVNEHIHVREVSESKLKWEDTVGNSIMPRQENSLSQSCLKSTPISKIEVESSGEKLGEESVKLGKNMTVKRKLPGKSEDEMCFTNQSQGEEFIGLGSSNDRVVVQALMAAPNCPRREGQLTFRSPSQVTPDRSRVKIHECMDLLRDSDDSPGHDEDDKFQFIQRSEDLDLSLIPFGLHTLVDKDDGDKGGGATRKKVKETLRLFQAIFRKLLRDEEAKLKEQVKSYRRIDLTSAKILKEKNKWVNTGKQILGPVPGVEVGDEFHYRVELAIIGLHRPFQAGIDYVRRGGTILATSIVASGGYADEIDSSDVMLYSGQGGNPTGRDKKAEDQKLERGNLALKNSMDERTPVRVIRGFKESKDSSSLDARGKIIVTYTYDGLYLVEKYWQEKGHHGTIVFMFKLRRIPGQPELALKEVKKSKRSRVREGLCVDDISQGKEKMPICAVNTIDDEKPPLFKYITNMIYPLWYNPVPPSGCECTDGCSDSVKCVCVVKNGGEIPFNNNGAIVAAKPLVYECGPSCKCPPSCHNRVSQHGIKFQLEIFKTESRGWGVRSLSSISSGSFICEYTGELLQDKEAEQRTDNDEYLFDIGNNYNDHALWDGLSTLIPPDLQLNPSHETVEDAGFTIDAAQYGSVGRFVNHSCSPNLYAQNVIYDHDDKKMPHIMLFASENIPPLQELTYHYNYKLDQVRDSDGNIKKKDCYCGSFECTGRMY